MNRQQAIEKAAKEVCFRYAVTSINALRDALALPDDTAEREPIAWRVDTPYGKGVSYSNEFFDIHPYFYEGKPEPSPERDALVARIDESVLQDHEEIDNLLTDLRAYLTRDHIPDTGEKVGE